MPALSPGCFIASTLTLATPRVLPAMSTAFSSASGLVAVPPSFTRPLVASKSTVRPSTPWSEASISFLILSLASASRSKTLRPMVRTKSNRPICSSLLLSISAADSVGNAFLGETCLGGAAQLLVGGRCIAGRLGVRLTLFHEAGQRRAGELFVRCLRFAGRGRRRALRVDAARQEATDHYERKNAHRILPGFGHAEWGDCNGVRNASP